MMFTVEIPDNAKDVKVSVTCDGKQYRCHESRYAPGRWNGLNGGEYYGQYFDMDDENRVREMTEVASELNKSGVAYTLTKLKRQYRIMISNDDYRNMNEELKKRILNINVHHDMLGGGIDA